MELRIYKYRIYPNSKQKIRLFSNFKASKTIYNDLLAMSKDAYKFGGVSLNRFDFNSFLKGQYSFNLHSQVKQDVGIRLHKAFQNFFRRIKGKERQKGFPRFKSRVYSITYYQSGFKFVNNRRLYTSKIGNIPIVLHRTPKGKIKTMTIKVNKANQWFAIFACELLEIKDVPPSKESIGIDVGLENFATLSNGEVITNPHFLIKAEKRIKILQRRVSRKVKGSNNRKNVRFRLSKQHLKVSNIRTDWLHKLSRSLTIRYGIISGETLDIKSMVKNSWFAKSINDASWGSFMNMLSYKAVASGGQFLENPRTRGSSHRCSKCGFYVENMPLSKRTFKCHECFNVLHRDHNSAVNHLKDTAGLAGIYTPVETSPLPALSGKASEVMEAGTTYGK